jgi:hypothetical protein
LGLKRRFRIGQLVVTKSGKVAKVIGSADYGFYKGRPMAGAWTEYRLKVKGSKKTMYRRENELRRR